ncbi:MAG TPA: tripartite tricarboxylate transporter substrate binding protein, partial [Burkholderiales bacterium]|nr:tripartite tricarboxylate transporter substrate binding protein [Burkholderiales bacterium]
MNCNLLSKTLGALLVLFLTCAQAWPQGYPERPITLIVPYPAGGGTDIVMRTLADVLARQMATRIVIENKSGAAGTIGPASMASARP